MDLTAYFYQVVTDLGDSNVTDKKNNYSVRNNSLFNTKLCELVASITYMRDYLVSNKKDYINIYNSILSMASTMTDEERDQIDKDVQDFVKLCNDVVKILKVESKSRKSRQQYEHENNAIILVENYIKSIYEFHNKQKALRLRRNLDSQNFFRLSKSIKGIESVQSNSNSLLSESPKSTRKKEKLINDSSKKNKSNVNSNYIFDEGEVSNNTSYGLSSEELKIFKDEGVRMYDEMNSMNDEVNQIGKKLTEIAKLQEAFSESVLKQETDLSHLNSTTITSTEYIREGNEQLREAMRKNAGFRVFILFFITTLAFVVLFLDWYNG